MKNLKSYIAGALTLVAVSTGITSCQDHFDDPTVTAPVATITPNTSIAEVKAWLWNDENNYCDTVFTRDYYINGKNKEDRHKGEHIVISGRVVSSDYAGNCFKYIVLQDETGALNFSINSYNLYLNYRRGQEVVVDLTEMYMGKYRGLLQVGFPSFNSSLPGYETSFMAPEFFSRKAQLNEWPDAAKVDTLVVNSFSEIGVTPTELRKWQSQIVRFNNVKFVENATLNTFSTYHSSGETQQIQDADGNTLDIRTSGYSNFWNMTIPEGRGDVIALLGYYVNLAGTGGWQLTLIDANACQNFGNPTVPQGSESNPYSVQQAIAYQVNDQGKSGWVRGYIVGTVAPEVETVTSNSDIEWNNSPVLGNTIVIGQTPETQDISECLVVALPQGTDLRTYGALRENPNNYKRQIDIRGTFAAVMGTYGITGNTGKSSEFHIDGVEPGGPVDEGDGTEAKPFNCAQVIAMNPSSTTEAVKSGIWVSGYIVGYYQDYAAHFEAGGTQRANILISDNADAAAATECVCIQLIAQTDTRNALNVVDNPGVLGQKVSIFGDVMKYNTLPGIKNTSNYKLDGSVTPPTPTGDKITLLGSTDADGVKDWTLGTSGDINVWAWREYNSAYYLNASAFISGAATASQAYAASPIIDLTAATSCVVSFEHAAKFQTTLRDLCGFAVRTEGASAWTNITIPTWPESGSWTFVNSGDIDLSAYIGKKIQVAFKYGSTDTGADTWEIRNLNLTGTGIKIEGAGTTKPDDPVVPPTPSSDYKGDFNSFNEGTPKASPYSTYTNATGWTLENGIILGGVNAGETEQNPRFSFIGDGATIAPCLNGKVSAPGKLYSGTLTGGIKKLTFNYGFAFAETKCRFTVQILQNGAVVKEDVITLDSIEQKKAYSYSLDLSISGDFQIVITNNCYGEQTGNKERVSIWNLTWEN